VKTFSFLLSFVFYSTMCIAKVVVIGLTVPIDITYIENQTVASEQEAKVLAVTLTNKIHEAGYTTSYVNRYQLDGDVCILYVAQSHIVDIQLTTDSDYKESIMQDLLTLKGSVYNRQAVHAFLLQLKEKYILDSIQVNVANYKEGDDVSLIIGVRAKTAVWSFEIATFPIYGVTPSMTVSVPLNKAVISGQGQVGLNEERVTLKKGVLEYMRYPSKIGWHAGLQVSQEYAVWERYGTDFTKTSAKPFLGIGVFGNRGVFGISAFMYGVATWYKVSEQDTGSKLHDTYKDAGLELRIRVTDDRTIAKKNTTFTATLFTGLTQEEYCVTSRAFVYFPLPVTSRLYIIPSGYSFYTTLQNRIYAEYVFDSYLLGYSNRYTATQSRHIARLELMYEVLYEFVFVDIFGSSGIYKTEYNRWEMTSSYGVGADVYYNTMIFNVGCAWNTDETISQYYIFTGVRAKL